MDTFRFPKVNSSFPSVKTFQTFKGATLNRMDMNLIVIFCFLAIALAVADFCKVRAQAKAAKAAKEARAREDLVKRIEAMEVTQNTFITNYKDLMRHLSTTHKARIVRDDMRRKYNDNSKRSAEIVSANHNSLMNYKKEKDALSAYLIQQT
jgi:hypothetical protein